MREDATNYRIEISVGGYGDERDIASLKNLLKDLEDHNYLNGYKVEIVCDFTHFCENCNREIDKLEEVKCTGCGRLGCTWCFIYELGEEWYCSTNCIPLERWQDGIH